MFQPRKPFWVGLLGLIGVACSGRGPVWQKNERWIDLDSIVRAPFPEGLNLDADATQHTGDYAIFQFREIYKHHLNGQTSYSETLHFSITAPDLEPTEFAQLLERGIFDINYRKADAQSRTGETGGWQWRIREVTYTRDPVIEPSWEIRVASAAKGLVVCWRGFQKQYSAEQALANLLELAKRAEITAEKANYFAQHRDFPTDKWREHYAANLPQLQQTLKDAGMPPVQAGQWTKFAEWNYTIDHERPQRFHLVRFVGSVAVPPTPFTLKGPLTYFRFIQGFWSQENQGGPGGLLPPSALEGLKAQLVDEGRVYFSRIQSLNLWVPYGTGEDSLGARFRQLVAEADRSARYGAEEANGKP